MHPGFRFKQANELERVQAIRLRDRIYEEETRHIPADHLDERAIHLVALAAGGVVVATSRLVGPECRPYEFERHIDLSAFTKPQDRIGLVGRFCVAHEWRQIPNSVWLHLGMLKLMYLTAKKTRITHLVMYTFDHLLTFYRGAYFEELDGVSFFHHGYQQTMHLMQLEIATFEQQHLRAGGRLAKIFSSIEAVTG